MLTSDEARSRAARGAQWLDKKDPQWFERVHLGSLDMGRGDACVVSQVTGKGFFRGSFALGLRGQKAGDLGLRVKAFSPPPKEEGQFMRRYWREYDLLTDAWKEEVLQRRFKAAAQGKEGAVA